MEGAIKVEDDIRTSHQPHGERVVIAPFVYQHVHTYVCVAGGSPWHERTYTYIYIYICVCGRGSPRLRGLHESGHKYRHMANLYEAGGHTPAACVHICMNIYMHA